MKLINISRIDVGWSFGATLLRIAANLIILPFILITLPSDDVGLWTIFLNISSFVFIFDFGFGHTFTRNVAYIFSGVKKLKSKGFIEVENHDKSIDFNLLKGTIRAMKRYYLFAALLFLFFILTFGTYYIYFLLEKYSGDKTNVYYSWVLFSVLIVYQLYTLYYDSLLQGKGMMRKAKQIIIIAQLTQILVTICTLYLGYGLISLVLGQISSVVVNRILAYKAFFNTEMVEKLKMSIEVDSKELFKIFMPNSLKIGLTSLGGFMVTKSAIFVGSLYLSLDQIASFGISKQVVDVIAGVGGIYMATFYPKLIQQRVINNISEMKKIYLESTYFLYIIFILGSLSLLTLGGFLLEVIGSNTTLINESILIVLLIITLLEANHSMAASILMTKNEVPFFKASLLSGLGTFIILIVYYNILSYTSLWGLVLAQGISQIIYQNWKWPLSVIKDLKISRTDLYIWRKSN